MLSLQKELSFCSRSFTNTNKTNPLEMAVFAIFFVHILLWHSREESEVKRLVLPDEFDVYQEFQALKKNVTLLQLENRDLKKQLSVSKVLFDI